jgi:hypothetical protein
MIQLSDVTKRYDDTTPVHPAVQLLDEQGTLT